MKETVYDYLRNQHQQNADRADIAKLKCAVEQLYLLSYVLLMLLVMILLALGWTWSAS